MTILHPTVTSVASIRTHYQPGPGRHWFDADTMKFFGTRLAQSAYVRPEGDVAFFVTSEAPPSGGRRYTVRTYTFATREISDLGGFLAYATNADATRAARNAARGF